MTAKWGNKRLEERLKEIDANEKARAEEAARPRTIDELVSAKVADVETSEKMAAALRRGLSKQLAFVDRKRNVNTSRSGEWFEANVSTASLNRVDYRPEVTYEAAPDAHRVRIISQALAGGAAVLEAHFLIPSETVVRRTRTAHEYNEWLVDIAKQVTAGHFRPPHGRKVNTEALLRLEKIDDFTPLGLIDQTGGTDAPEPEIDADAAIASIRRAFEEED